MADPVTIPQIPPNQDTDYEALYTEGIHLLQALAGNTWTDYNEHDPGVTILENLCYALTDLYERTEIPVENLLTGKDGSFPAKENALFTASQILHNSALTLNDYRKLLIDGVKDVYNCWVSAYYLTNPYIDDPVGISGMYEVVIDLADNPSADQENIQKEIQKLLDANRKITEYFPAIKFLAPKDVVLNCKINVQESVNVEELLANILFDISFYMKPGVNFYTYDELVTEGQTTEQIFEGPALMNGFIPDTALTGRMTILYVDLLLKHIIGNKGVASVNMLSIDVDTQKHIADVYKIDPDITLILDVKKSLDSIYVFKQNTACLYSKALVISTYNELRSKNNKKGKFKFNRDMLDIPIPEGKYVDAAEYYSIQNEFPLIYGIGKERLTGKATDKRKAQALQLKSYLLFYEQLMADFMSQTANLGNLLSSAHQNGTYFFQPLYGVPDGVPLLKGFKGEPSIIYTASESKRYMDASDELIADPDNAYISGLKAIYINTDDYNRRRNAFLDHLLARFNFVMDPFPALPNNTDDIAAAVVLKESVLANMVEITSSRGNFNPPDINNQSGFDTSFSMLLHSLSGIRYGNPETSGETTRLLNPVAHHGESDVFKQDSNGQISFNTIHPDFLATTVAGLFIDNYSIEKHQGEWVFYLDVQGKKHTLLKKPVSENEAPDQSVSEELVSHFLDLYLKFENIFVIEHIDLLPALTEEKFIWKNAPAAVPLTKNPGNYSKVLQQIDQSYTNAGQQNLVATMPDPVIAVSNNTTYVHQDFYSSRLSVVIPRSAVNLDKNPTYRNYFNSIVVNTLPAHVCLNIFWLEDDLYNQFIISYKSFILEENSAKEAMASFLLLQQPYQSFNTRS